MRAVFYKRPMGSLIVGFASYLYVDEEYWDAPAPGDKYRVFELHLGKWTWEVCTN